MRLAAADSLRCGTCAGTEIVRVLATTIQQLFLLLLDALSAPSFTGAEHSTAPMASATAGVTAATGGSVESMSIVMASPTSAQQRMDVHSPTSVTMDMMPTGSASTTSDQAAPGESSGLKLCRVTPLAPLQAERTPSWIAATVLRRATTFCRRVQQRPRQPLKGGNGRGDPAGLAEILHNCGALRCRGLAAGRRCACGSTSRPGAHRGNEEGPPESFLIFF